MAIKLEGWGGLVRQGNWESLYQKREMDFWSKGSNLRWHLDIGISQYPNKTKSWERPCLLINNLIQKHFLENKDMNIKITICRFGWVDYIRIRGSSTPLYSGFSKFSFLFLILIQDKMHESVLNNGSLLFITVEPPPPRPLSLRILYYAREMSF